MVHGENRIPYWIDRRLNGLAGPEYDATISFRLASEPVDSQYGECRLKEVRQLEGSQLGPLVYRVAFSLDANLLPNDYQIQDGDAAFLKPGTAIHSVNGYDPSKWLAAIVDGEVLLFESLGQGKPLEQ